MVPVYNLVIDIVATDNNIPEGRFREQIQSSLNYLQALKGAFGSDPCRIVYYPPNGSPLNPDAGFWSVRIVVLISVGKKRGEHLLELYQALLVLITHELPGYDIRAEYGMMKFS